jgi:hypothetical protein
MKQLLIMVIILAFLGFVVGANAYLANRFAWYMGVDSPKYFYLGFAAITFFMIGGLIAFSNTLDPLGSVVYQVAAITMGFVLYLMLSTIFVDLIHFVIKLQPIYYGIIVVGLAVCISSYGLWNAGNLRIIEHEVPIKGLKNEVAAMHISDVHIGHFRGKSFLQKIVDETNRQNPDVVFITGDLLDGKINLSEETLSPLKQLRAPIYFVEGNHDNYTDFQTIKKILRKMNVSVLENEITSLEGIQIIGLNHMMADETGFGMHAAQGYATIKSVLVDLEIVHESPSILLHHSPDGMKYVNEHGIDLYLAGHTHAGQLFPINYLNDLLFAYNKGLHNYNGTQIYVSDGAGTFGPPMRVGTRSEIALLKLIPAH